jgi:hypothetical protein
MRATRFALTGALALVSLTALAHGPQLQITRDGGKISTRSIFREEPYNRLTDTKSVYVIPLLETSGVWYSRPNNAKSSTTGLPEYTSGPGIAFGYAAAFDTGNHFNLNLIAGLMEWSGASFSDPGVEQLQAYRTNSAGVIQSSAVTTDSLTVSDPATMAYGNISSINAGSHSGTSFRLLGDGAIPGGGDDGVYLLTMTLSSTQSTVVDSDPYYFVLHKNAADADVEAAVDELLYSLRIGSRYVQFVPEPGSMTLALIGAAGVLLRQRSKKRRG